MFRVVRFMSRLYGVQFRVLLTIDDLHRCEHNRVVSVLQAIELLNDEVKRYTDPSQAVVMLVFNHRSITSVFNEQQQSEGTETNGYPTLYISHIYDNVYSHVGKSMPAV